MPFLRESSSVDCQAGQEGINRLPAFIGQIDERVRREPDLLGASAWKFGPRQQADGAVKAGHSDLVSVKR